MSRKTRYEAGFWYYELRIKAMDTGFQATLPHIHTGNAARLTGNGLIMLPMLRMWAFLYVDIYKYRHASNEASGRFLPGKTSNLKSQRLSGLGFVLLGLLLMIIVEYDFWMRMRQDGGGFLKFREWGRRCF